MEEEINFDVFHFFGSEVNHVQFAIPWNDLTFHNFVRRIIKECDPENGRFDLHFLSILYINLEGDHVPLKWNEDEYRKFLDFVRRSKECGYEHIHLIIPNIGNEKSKSDRAGKLRKMRLKQNPLSLRELKDLFSLEIDCGKSFKNVEDLHTSCANLFLPQPRFSSTTAYQEQSSKREKISPSYGMLDVKRYSEDDLPRLLADGSKILVLTEDGNYLLMSFSKNDTYAPYNSFAWQSGQGEPNFPKYRCQHVRVPACVEKNDIRVSDESKNLIASLLQLDQIVEQRIQESEQSRSRDTCVRSQHVSQPGVIEQPTPEHGFQQQAPFLNDPKFQNENNVPLLEESKNGNHEEEIPAWFHRHMEKFKTDLVADMKKDFMENVKQMLLVHHGPPNSGHDTSSLENEENTRESSSEDGASEREAKETKDDWEIVRRLANDEIGQNFAAIATAHCSDQLTETDSDAVRDLEYDECLSVAGKSNCASAPDEFHDSDSSVSIISDNYVHDDDDVSLDSESSFIRIPRCFVTQRKDDRESSPAGVPVRVKKHRKSKSTKFTVSTTESNISLVASSSREGIASMPVEGGKLTTPMAKIEKPVSNSSSQTEINIETSPEKRNPSVTVHSASSISSGGGSGGGGGSNCSSSSSPPRKQKPKTSFSGGDDVPRNGSESADRKNIESEKTQPLDILPDKVFEMTSNVFKNVLNSVKIPNSNGVKESMQKVFEESMSAASRLIPNPSLTGTIPLPPEDSNISGRNAAVRKHASPSTSTLVRNASVPRPRTSVNDYVSRFHDLSDKIKAELALLNEMGFLNNGHNLFLLTKYPDDMEKVIESLVNFTVS